MNRPVKVLSVLVLLCLVATRVSLAQSTITLTANYWDFLDDGTASGTYGGSAGVGQNDFQSYNAGSATGLVQSTLGSNGLPVFASTNGHGSGQSITSATTFAQWFQTTPGVNVYVPGSLTLTNNGSGTYSYSSNAFFPLDGLGFNSGGFQTANGHNYAFTTHVEFTGEFTNTSQFISFTGDDDAWVFINGHLVIDLGGVHGATSAVFDDTIPALSSIGVSLGEQVTVDIFQANRHTTASDFDLSTNIAGISAVPEPSTWALLAGCAALLLAAGKTIGARRRDGEAVSRG